MFQKTKQGFWSFKVSVSSLSTRKLCQIVAVELPIYINEKELVYYLIINCYFIMCGEREFKQENVFFCFFCFLFCFKWCEVINYFCEWKEYHDNIGDLDGPEEKEKTQGKIQKFISALWFLTYLLLWFSSFFFSITVFYLHTTSLSHCWFVCTKLLSSTTHFPAYEIRFTVC